MAVEMEGLEFQIEAKIDEGAKGIDSLAKSLAKLSKALGNINTARLEGLGRALEAVSKIGNVTISRSVATQLGNIATAMSGISDADVTRLERVTDALQSLSAVGNVRLPRLRVPTEGMVAETAAPATNTTAATSGVTQAVTSTQQVSAAVEQVTQRTGTLRNVLSGIGGVFKSTFSFAGRTLLSLGRGLGKVAVGAGKATLGMFNFKKTAAGLGARMKQITSGLGQMFSSLKRIAMYRAARFVLAQLTKAFKEGINNLYQYSNAMGGTFAASMNSMATSALYLKNSLGAMAAPIVNALAPAIDYISGKIVSLLNLINQLMAALSGKSFIAAKKIKKNYGDAFGGAAGSAKEAADKIKSYTTGIDELNIIQETPENDSGGGGGGGGVVYSSMFEELPIDSEIAEFANKLKEAFNNADWKTLGTLLGDKLNEIVDSIDYSGIGKKIGFGINGTLATLYHLLDTFDFTNLGVHLGTLVNAGLEEWDTSYWGALFVKKFTILPDLIIGAIQGLDWKLIGKRIGDFFIGAFDEVTKWITKYDWGQLASELWQSIKDLLSGVDWSAVVSSAAKALGAALGALTKFVVQVLKDIWADIVAYFNPYIEECGGNVIEGFLLGVLNAIVDFGAWCWQNIVKPFIDGIKSGFGINSPATTMIEQGGYIAEGLLQGILKPFKNIGTWLNTNIVQPIVNFFKGSPKPEFSVDVKNDSQSWWSKIKGWWSKLTSSGSKSQLTQDVGVTLKKDGWTTVKQWIGNIPLVTQTVGLVKSGWNTVKSWIGALPTISQGISLMKSGWTSVKNWIGSHVIDVGVSLFKSGWSSLSSWIGTSVSVGISLFKNGWTSLKTWFGLANGGIIGANGSVQLLSSGGSIRNGATDLWDAIPKYANGTANIHGSMFVAGERGAELVGHVNGRTEVLNRSQLGQVMHRSIVDGMRQFAGYWNAINTHMTTCTNAMISAMLVSADAVYAGMNTSDVVMVQSVGAWMDNLSNRVEAALAGVGGADQIAEGVREGMYEVTARQNDLLREQNDLLQRLLNKNTTVQIGNKTIKEAVVTQDNADGYRFTK